MEAFQELRQTRCQTIYQTEIRQDEALRLPPGPEREARDQYYRSASFRKSEADEDERMREEWEQISETFGYSAKEEAENWWVKWGVLRESSKDMSPFDPVDLTYQVTEVTEVT
jgi:salicylate hydroxylase